MPAQWTDPKTWTAASALPASDLNTYLRNNLLAINGYVEKTADESVTSSATLQNDNHLFYTIGQAGTYIADVYLYASSAANAAGDISLGFTFPSGTLHFDAIGQDATLASGSTGTVNNLVQRSAVSGTSFLSRGLSTSELSIQMHVWFKATASGTLQLQWAQQNSNASASTVLAGSHMLVRQVA